MNRFSFAALLSLALVACGGGSEEPDTPQSPRIEMVQTANQWPDIYPKARLVFNSRELVGFLPAVKAEEIDRVCWDSTGIVETPATQGCGKLLRDASGHLYAEVPLWYATDSGVFVAMRKAGGLPPSMDVPDWQLPSRWSTFLGFGAGVYLRYDLR